MQIDVMLQSSVVVHDGGVDQSLDDRRTRISDQNGDRMLVHVFSLQKHTSIHAHSM